MEWSNESVLEFLRLYEQESVIWNAKHLKHRDRNAVSDAWSNIQKSFSLQCTVQELKKKKESLMSTFRPLLSKVKCSMKTGSSAEDVYKPNWFAYETMAKFLFGACQPRSTISTKGLEEDMSSSADMFDNCSAEANVDISTSTVESCTPPTRKNNKKRKLDSTDVIEKRMEDAYNIMKTVCDKPKKNRCQLYGELLGEKLSEFDEKTQYFLMHEMDTLILKTKFQIENQLPTTSQPNYQLENLQQNVPTASYNSYNFPTSINSASSFYSQPSPFSYAQQFQHPQNISQISGMTTDESNTGNTQHGY